MPTWLALMLVVLAAGLAVPISRALFYGRVDQNDPRDLGTAVDGWMVGLQGAALVFWPWCAAVAVDVVGDFGAGAAMEYYSTAAQLTPLLFIVVVFELHLLRTDVPAPALSDVLAPADGGAAQQDKRPGTISLRPPSKPEDLVRDAETRLRVFLFATLQVLIAEGASLYALATRSSTTVLTVGIGLTLLLQFVVIASKAFFSFYERLGVDIEFRDPARPEGGDLSAGPGAGESPLPQAADQQ